MSLLPTFIHLHALKTKTCKIKIKSLIIFSIYEKHANMVETIKKQTRKKILVMKYKCQAFFFSNIIFLNEYE